MHKSAWGLVALLLAGCGQANGSPPVANVDPPVPPVAKITKTLVYLYSKKPIDPRWPLEQSTTKWWTGNFGFKLVPYGTCDLNDEEKISFYGIVESDSATAYCARIEEYNERITKYPDGNLPSYGDTQFDGNIPVIRLNKFYIKDSPEVTLCHELGHVAGVPHTKLLNSCMGPGFYPNPSEEDLGFIRENVWTPEQAKAILATDQSE